MYFAVALSGGIDSLTVALLLREAGHRVLALHGVWLPEEDSGLSACLPLLASHDIPLHRLDLARTFRDQVMTPSFLAWHRGETPNPCALCNRHLKFGALLRHAEAEGCDALATGHYARLSHRASTPLLATADDASKDQSYFLSLVEAKALPHLCFPLQDRSKEDCRTYLSRQGFSRPPKESQDICFLPRDSSARMRAIEAAWPSLARSAPPQGPILLWSSPTTSTRLIQPHQGLWRYTEGQRRGLGIPYSEGLYVLAKDFSTHTLHVGPRRLLGMTGLTAEAPNLFCSPDLWPSTLYVKVRSRTQRLPASVRLKPGSLEVEFAEPVFPTAKGQILSVSDQEGRILAGGLIARVHTLLEDRPW